MYVILLPSTASDNDSLKPLISMGFELKTFGKWSKAKPNETPLLAQIRCRRNCQRRHCRRCKGRVARKIEYHYDAVKVELWRRGTFSPNLAEIFISFLSAFVERRKRQHFATTCFRIRHQKRNFCHKFAALGCVALQLRQCFTRL